MTRFPTLKGMLALGLSVPLVACSGSPENPGQSLQCAMQAGDQEAALVFAHLDGAPAQLHHSSSTTAFWRQLAQDVLDARFASRQDALDGFLGAAQALHLIATLEAD